MTKQIFIFWNYESTPMFLKFEFVYLFLIMH